MVNCDYLYLTLCTMKTIIDLSIVRKMIKRPHGKAPMHC